MSDHMGLLSDLQDAICNDASPMNILIAFGRCLVFGVTVPASERLVVTSQLEHIRPWELPYQIRIWTASASSLGARWDAEDDPQEADALCITLLQLRTDALAIEMALTELAASDPAVTAAIGSFDEALRWHIDVLSTVCRRPWFDNYRLGFFESFTPPLPWWVGDEIEEAEQHAFNGAVASLPPEDYWAAVKRLREERGI